jgi:hypothetical protein
VSEYRLGAERLPGRFTSRADLAHALVREAVTDGHVGAFLDVRTTKNTPRLLDVIKKEGFGK